MYTRVVMSALRFATALFTGVLTACGPRAPMPPASLPPTPVEHVVVPPPAPPAPAEPAPPAEPPRSNFVTVSGHDPDGMYPPIVFFASGSSKLTAESEAELSRVSDVLKKRPDIRVLEVQGHVDIREARTHRDLSKKRADEVRRWLLASGIEPERLVAVGHGETRPRAHNGTPDGRAQNRRVTLIILEKEQP